MNQQKYKNLFYPNSNVLKNRLKINDSTILKEAEKLIVSSKLADLKENPDQFKEFGSEFDSKHLLSIHKYLFEDIYDWAGSYKVASLYKGQDILNDQTVPYCPLDLLETNLNTIFSDLKTIQWDKLSDKEKVLKFADEYQYLWQCHPFNEGNTRTTSVFMQQYALEKKIPIDFKKLFQDPTTLRNSFCLYALGKPKSDEIMNNLFLSCMSNSKEVFNTNDIKIVNFKFNNFLEYGTNQTKFLEVLDSELKKEGFEKFATGYSHNNNNLTVDDYLYHIQNVKNNVPDFDKIINDITLSSLSETIDLQSLLLNKTVKDVQYINSIAAKKEEQVKKEIMNETELLHENKKVRYGEASPDLLVGKKFQANDDVFIIKKLELVPGQTKDMAMLERQSDGQIFQDPDFASNTPLKLNLKGTNELTKSNKKNIDKVISK